MKHKINYEFEDDYDYNEEFGRYKDRRKPKGRRSVRNLKLKDDKKLSSIDEFDDPNLQELYEQGILTKIIREIKSGKEATVYLADGQYGLMAAKIYRDEATRAFSKDQIYKAGRHISHQNRKKITNLASKNQMKAEQGLWIYHEYKTIWEFYKAGIRVPKPLIGPSVHDIAKAGRVVLMEYIGNKEEAAPRLSDVSLDKDEAQNAWQQTFAILKQVLKLGKVHGDFSTYNLLWWKDQAILIDFPQVVNISENKHAKEILKTDLNSLAKSFQVLGIDKDPKQLYKELIKELGPLF